LPRKSCAASDLKRYHPKEQWMNPKTLLLITLPFVLSACAFVTQPIKYEGTESITKEIYQQNKNTNGTVLFDINWGRKWGCGSFENAQLISLAFDKLPMKTINNEVEPALVVHSPSRLMVDPVFLHYAYSLEPGEYAISAVSIKVAEAGYKVGFFTAQRDKLYVNGKPIGGTFTVNSKEPVYIGGFYIDCTYQPILWRYYLKDKEKFGAQVKAYKKSFPFLDLSNIKFRLFKTKEFGEDYELAE